MVDNLTPEQRSHCMSRVRNRDTNLEATVRSALFQRGWRFRKHVHSLPGRPDIVFAHERVVVFVDGDFWHGYRFSRWRDSLSDFWRAKIEINRQRDKRNFSKLQKLGWRVVRVWQHQIEKNLAECVQRIERALRQRDEEAVIGKLKLLL